MKFVIQDHERLVLHANPNAQGLTVGALRGDADRDSLAIALADFNRAINDGPQRQRAATVELAKERFADWLRPAPEPDKAATRQWRVETDCATDHVGGNQFIVDETGEEIAEMAVTLDDTDVDRAALIVRAVKAHDGLVEVAKALVEHVEKLDRLYPGQALRESCGTIEIALRARKVLAQVQP